MTEQTLQDLPLDSIRPAPDNRKRMDPAKLKQMAESIKEKKVMQPILVRPIPHKKGDKIRFEIVYGERRWRGSEIAGEPTIPSMVRELSDAEAAEMRAIENLQREDVHPLEEAEGYNTLIKQHHYTIEQLASKVGMSKAYIHTTVKLLDLVPEARKAFFDEKLTKTTALMLARIPVKTLQAKAVKEITDENRHQGPMSARAAQEHIHDDYMLQLKAAPFKTNDATLCPSAGACSECPKRTGNQPELFADVESVDVCTDPVCFGKKRDAHKKRLITLAKDKGQKIISGPDAKKIMPYFHMSSLQGGFAPLDSKCHDDTKKRTYRQILGKSANATLLENPHGDDLIEIVRLSDVEQLLKEKGIQKPRSVSSSVSAEEKKRQEKVKIEKEFRRRLFTAVREKPVGLSVEMLRVIATSLYSNIDQAARPLIMELYAFDKAVNEWPDRDKKLRLAIESIDPKALVQFVVDLALVGDISVNQYGVERKPEQLLAAAARAGIDAEQIKATVKAEAKAKLDTKKKPAAKKVAAVPVPKKAAAKKAAPAKSAEPAKKKVQSKTAKPAAPGGTGVVKTVLNPAVAWPFPTGTRP
jgi:ParB/RepB/Spo0J family partition protein